MTDPTSDLGKDTDEEDAPRCNTCDEPILSPSHRVITWIEDGTVHAAHFCDETCRSAWDGE